MNYLLTGSTGFIGGMMVKYLMQLHPKKEITFVLPVRNLKTAKEKFSGILDENVKFVFIECPLEKITKEKFPKEISIDYIIHCAAPTSSGYMLSNPVETADSIVLGTRNMLELARHFHVKSMVYLSSMEVYGVVEDIGRKRNEEELGSLDLENVRSCYPMGKRMAEHYCHIYQQEYGIPVKIARLAQIFGKGVRLNDNRVYMQFAKAVIEKRDIVLKTEGKTIGNYCASEDAMSAIYTILIKGKDGEVYNVVNEGNTMAVRDMAEFAAEQIADGKIKVKIELEDLKKTGYAPYTGLIMSGKKLQQLGWKPVKGMFQMYEDVLIEIKKSSFQ